MALISVLAALPVSAHQFAFTEAHALLLRNGSYRVDMTVDVDALALGVSPLSDSAENVARLNAMSAEEFDAAVERARSTLLRRVRIRFDGVAQRPRLTFPDAGQELDDEPVAPGPAPSVLGITARFSGAIPPAAREFRFSASRAFASVHLAIVDQTTGEGASYVLAAAEESPAFRLGAPPVEEGRLRVARRYLELGFEHILPRGLDHMLFVLGLFFLCARLGPLLWQVSAFTVAHTITLGLSMYGLVSLPSRPVETLIALSIAYVGIENLATEELKPWRPAMVFVFGLLHGMGFAGALRALGLPEGRYLMALLSFNLGVELGQLSVILVAVAAVGWARHAPWRRRWIVVPASAAIACVGLFWTVQRLLAPST